MKTYYLELRSTGISYTEICKRKANCIGHILRRKCFLQRIIEGEIKWGREVTGRRGRRRREILDDLRDRRE
jgi:hypothetical protein